eukprot:CAMPEP_0204424044 /NCGR_PEP_ID=MMETSP0470-20130426/44061_1 /ASSEMBLY_ACC=CAM_ASM_000385 /TAXON_ID=2969 /ORGANISM="Oxyrrhis marina" /LENGTH=52 /DNA_ID=CAMNT_0051421501 /DNA_START=38 /DNA_END=193 /DNA_ORIENTATION=-
MSLADFLDSKSDNTFLTAESHEEKLDVSSPSFKKQSVSLLEQDLKTSEHALG